MTTQSAQFALANNGNFQQRCIAAATSYGVSTVYAESTGSTDYANRRALAFQVIFYPQAWAPRFALAAVMANANLQAAAPSDPAAADADVLAGVTTVWNGLADALANLQTAKVI